jgi:2-amino-4-hydroxy-6-hydroxymethyldihydropteridine diphosphokinase
MRTAVALGSNLGDRLANLRAARQAIVDLPAVRSPIRSSAVYETAPVDVEANAQNFLNAVLEFEFDGEPNELMAQLLAIEESLGRKREHARKLSRTIDLDLLYQGESKIDRQGLQLPHPRLQLRRFVLQPLADIRPELVLPNQTQSVRELLAQTADSAKVVRLMENW